MPRHHLRRARAAAVSLSVLGGLLLVPAAPAAAHTTVDDRISTSRMTADRTYQLFTVRPDGSAPVQLTSGGRSKCDPAMSPDARQVAFSHGTRISVVAADGSGAKAGPAAETLVASVPDDEYVRGPAWSRDGTTIAYTASVDYDGGSNPAYRTAVFTATFDGVRWGAPVELAMDATAPRYSTLTDEIVLSIGSVQTGERDLWTWDLASGAQTQVTSLPGSEAMATWHPTKPGLLLFTNCARGVYTVRAGESPVRVGALTACDAAWSSAPGERVVVHTGSTLSVYDLTTKRSTVVDRKANDRQPDW